MKLSLKPAAALLLVAQLATCQFGVYGQARQADIVRYPDVAQGRGLGERGRDANKLTPELRILFTQFNDRSRSSRRSAASAFSTRELREVFGISDPDSADPDVGVAVNAKPAVDLNELTRQGMKIFMRRGNTVYGQIPVRALSRLAGVRSVLRISSTKAAKTPRIPNEAQFGELKTTTLRNAGPIMSRSTADTGPFANEFNKQGLTGKGVIIGVIDSGIDWRHEDFVRPDGTSRIIAIWDYSDDSFRTSNGKIGGEPPRFDPGEPLWGTVYTNSQINAALKGKGTVNSVDNQGHGTATAGTAAGNGRSASGKYAGVAPEADLIVVKAGDCGGIDEGYIYGAAWIVEKAKELKRPVVVNASFGGHFSTHNGTEQEELLLNSLTGKGVPGVVFTVAAGNEGRYNLHGAGQFGPRRTGQQDITSQPLTVHIPPERAVDGTILLGVFDARDEWGTVVQPDANPEMLDKNGKPLWFYVFKSDGEIKYLIGDGLEQPEWFDGYAKNILSASQIGETHDVLVLPLPSGRYRLWGFGATQNVKNGNFDFYAPNYPAVDFGVGTAKSGMVGSPGNAAHVITVGAYNFRKSWVSIDGGETTFNFKIGEISDYSSPGGKRHDGVVKPDIAAPATYTISPLAQSAGPDSRSCEGDSMGASLGKRYITTDGKHVAWSGTSAAAPFTAGVIALMLQKNPTLDVDQVRSILTRTAGKGADVGSVPNPQWGNGMLNPAAALAGTPVAPKRRR